MVSKSSFWGGRQVALIAMLQVPAKGIADLNLLKDVAIRKHAKRPIMTRDMKRRKNEIHYTVAIKIHSREGFCVRFNS
jgi:hypothetical protein